MITIASIIGTSIDSAVANYITKGAWGRGNYFETSSTMLEPMEVLEEGYPIIRDPHNAMALETIQRIEIQAENSSSGSEGRQQPNRGRNSNDRRTK